MLGTAFSNCFFVLQQNLSSINTTGPIGSNFHVVGNNTCKMFCKKLNIISLFNQSYYARNIAFVFCSSEWFIRNPYRIPNIEKNFSTLLSNSRLSKFFIENQILVSIIMMRCVIFLRDIYVPSRGFSFHVILPTALSPSSPIPNQDGRE